MKTTLSKLFQEQRKLLRRNNLLNELKYQGNRLLICFLIINSSDLSEDKTITVYRCGPLVDLCRGPHIPNTTFVKAIACLKVKLYDNCDKLLDSKIVKLGDAVRPGETLTFGAYLVDIGDPHGDSKPIPNLILQREKIIADRDGVPNSKTSKSGPGIRKATSINLSPSQKMIREFKRRKVNKYSSSPSCPDTIETESSEWQVLYTAQLTQKAKKFHDGILRVAISGLRGKQAVLYDATRRVLDSRFLRNEEIIKAGESLRFDGHIVDILELEDHKPLTDTNVDGRNCSTQNKVQSKVRSEHLAGSETDMSSAAANAPYTIKSNSKEWNVMYTTQVTQKAKKFHDGVLKLSGCGSQGRQATLFSEDGTTLSHVYLKLSEDINNGSSFNMPNYLVEIGEIRKSIEEESPRKASISENQTLKVRSFRADNIKLRKRIPATMPLPDGEPPKNALSLQDEIISTTISENKPLRDARSILSILKKPSTQEGVAIGKVHADELHAPHASIIESGTKYQVEGLQDSSRKNEVDVCSEETRDIQCKPVDTTEPPISADSVSMIDKLQKEHSEYGFSFVLDTSVITRSVSTVKNRPLSSTEEPRALEAFSVGFKSLPSVASEMCCQSSGAMDVGGHLEVMFSKETSTSNFKESAEELKDQSNTEISGDNKMIDACVHDDSLGAGATTLGCNHHDVSNDGRKGFENTNSRNDYCPSFDLGFD